MFETNSLIEEFMLLANVAVAEKITSHFPSNSILRKHSSPKVIQVKYLNLSFLIGNFLQKKIKDFAKLLEKLGYEFDHSNSKDLADSLDRLTRNNDPFFNQLIRILTTRCMNEVGY